MSALRSVPPPLNGEPRPRFNVNSNNLAFLTELFRAGRHTISLMDKRDLRTLESWRRGLHHALREGDSKRNFATELQGIYLEGLLEAITRAIARIKHSDVSDPSGTGNRQTLKRKENPPVAHGVPFPSPYWRANAK